MIIKILQETEINMTKCINIFKNNIIGIHTNRISSNLLDNIKINCYEKQILLSKISSIFVENFNTLIVTPFDSFLISKIEKSILLSKLNLNLFIVNKTIRVSLPPLTIERRHNFIKISRSEAEYARILIRNLRRDVNIKVKRSYKKKIINHDECYCLLDKIQKLTDLYIKKIDKILKKKESELMKF